MNYTIVHKNVVHELYYSIVHAYIFIQIDSGKVYIHSSQLSQTTEIRKLCLYLENERESSTRPQVHPRLVQPSCTFGLLVFTAQWELTCVSHIESGIRTLYIRYPGGCISHMLEGRYPCDYACLVSCGFGKLMEAGLPTRLSGDVLSGRQ